MLVSGSSVVMHCVFSTAAAKHASISQEPRSLQHQFIYTRGRRPATGASDAQPG